MFGWAERVEVYQLHLLGRKQCVCMCSQWFESGGIFLPKTGILSDHNIGGMSTVLARLRLVGGGGDGGSTGAESRDCYLDMYKEKKASKVQHIREDIVYIV